MQIAHTRPARPSARRAAYAVAGLLSITSALALAHSRGGWWQLVVFGLAPDIALLIGFGGGLERGRLHPRAVPAYNALHSCWGPCLLALATVALPGSFLIAALAWAFHIFLDRALGYGKRTPDGFQRS